MSARGRRSGGGDTRAEIIDVARGLFAAKGYDGTSVRGVAREAGVDPALVHHYFDGKPGLFSEVIGVPAGIEEQIAAAVAGPPEGAGERIVRTYLRVWDGPEGRARFRALVGAVASHEEAAHLLRNFVSRSVLTSLAHIFGDEDVIMPPRILELAAATSSRTWRSRPSARSWWAWACCATSSRSPRWPTRTRRRSSLSWPPRSNASSSPE